jgi:hypothetical protein
MFTALLAFHVEDLDLINTVCHGDSAGSAWSVTAALRVHRRPCQCMRTAMPSCGSQRRACGQVGATTCQKGLQQHFTYVIWYILRTFRGFVYFSVLFRALSSSAVPDL